MWSLAKPLTKPLVFPTWVRGTKAARQREGGRIPNRLDPTPEQLTRRVTLSDRWGRCPGVDYCSQDVHGTARTQWGRTVDKRNNREKPSNDLRKLGSQAKSSGCDLLKISVKSCTLGPKTPTMLDGMTAEDTERDLFVVE